MLIEHRNLVFDITSMSDRFISIPLPPSKSKATDRIDDLWDMERFKEIKDINPITKVELNSWTPRVLDLPLKKPGDSLIILPLELQATSAFILKVLSFVAETHPEALDRSYIYLTTDNSTMAPLASQRNPGMHVDGFQGSRLKELLPVDHSYICWQGISPLFYPYSFNFDNLDISIHDVFREAKIQTKEQKYKPLMGKENTIYKMDAYQMHEAGWNPNLYPVPRVFWRLSFSVREFDRLGNTLNPALELEWDMVLRDAHKHLTSYR